MYAVEQLIDWSWLGTPLYNSKLTFFISHAYPHADQYSDNGPVSECMGSNQTSPLNSSQRTSAYSIDS